LDHIILLLNGQEIYGIHGGLSAPYNVTIQDPYTTENGSNVVTGIRNVTMSVQDNIIGNDYLSDDVYQSIRLACPVHLALACVMLICYLIGPATVTVYKGLNWRENVRDGLISLPYSDVFESLYLIADKVVPRFLWVIWFLISDPLTWYYCLFVGISLIGYNYSISWYAFHVMDVVAQVKEMGYVIRSVTRNWLQVLVTLALAILLIYVYLIVGMYYFGFESYNFGESVDLPYTLLDKFMEHVDWGLGNPPGFFDYSADAALKHLFGMSYRILVVVIMVAIITGIIINTFQDLAAESISIEQDIQNVCLICNLNRQVFERNRVKFGDHVDREHHCWNYLYYRMYLDGKEATKMSAKERVMYQKFKRQDIDYFPKDLAMSLADSAKGEEDMLTTLANKVDTMEGSIVDLKALMRASFNKLLHEAPGSELDDELGSKEKSESVKE